MWIFEHCILQREEHLWQKRNIARQEHCNHSTQELRPEDYCELEASIGYIVKLGPARGTQQDHVWKKKKDRDQEGTGPSLS